MNFSKGGLKSLSKVFKGKIWVKCIPIRSSLEYPKILAIDSFTSVIFPALSVIFIKSLAVSMKVRNFSSDSFKVSSARLRSLMSLTTLMIPTGFPELSYSTVALESVSISLPSAVKIVYSVLSWTSPSSNVFFVAFMASARSLGDTNSKAFRPISSSLLLYPTR